MWSSSNALVQVKRQRGDALTWFVIMTHKGGGPCGLFLLCEKVSHQKFFYDEIAKSETRTTPRPPSVWSVIAKSNNNLIFFFLTEAPGGQVTTTVRLNASCFRPQRAGNSNYATMQRRLFFIRAATNGGFVKGAGWIRLPGLWFSCERCRCRTRL